MSGQWRPARFILGSLGLDLVCGAKGEEAVARIMGMGPVSSTQLEAQT